MKINLMADSSATRVPVMPGGSMVYRLNQRGCQNIDPDENKYFCLPVSLIPWHYFFPGFEPCFHFLVNGNSTDYGRFGRQNKLRPYLKFWNWDLIFGHAVKAISSPGVCSPGAVASEGIELIQSPGDIEVHAILSRDAILILIIYKLTPFPIDKAFQE